MREDYKTIETKLIHAGEPEPGIDGAVILPIFQTAMFEATGGAGLDAIRYIRLNNTPNHIALHRKLAALENGEAALVTASGMAAISTTLLTVLSSGDHLLAQECLYGGTHGLITGDLPNLGISCDFINVGDPASWENRLRPTTRAIYVETVTNPLLQVGDLQAVVAFAKAHSLVSIIDNTIASPIYFRPPEWGFDLSVHSCTKYLNGHSDLVAGAVIGRKELIEKITRRLNHLGGSLDPHAAFLLHRGMKTLAVRIRYQSESALKIAEFLERHSAVAKVHYPGLASHPDHARARKLFDGFSGVLSFEPGGGVAAAERILATVVLPMKAPSLGGVETLITRPAMTSHSGMSPWLRRWTGQDKGFGYIDDATPELAMAVLPEYRDQGVGTRLLTHLLETAKLTCPLVSLAVRAANPAVRLYERLGFMKVKRSEKFDQRRGWSYKMKIDFHRV